MFVDLTAVAAIAAGAALVGSIVPLVDKLVRGRMRGGEADDNVTVVYEADGEERTISVDPKNEQQIRDLLKALEGKDGVRTTADAAR